MATGKLRWVFQTVHHDLWDRDVPAQPSLIDLTIDGKVMPALVMPTKQGDLYVLDRRSGQPILPVRELPAPASTVPGGRRADATPFVVELHSPALTGKDIWGATPLDQLVCRIELRQLGYDGPYTPPSTQRTLVYPGNLGVFNWGGVAVDPVRQSMVGSPAFLAFTFELIKRPAFAREARPGFRSRGARCRTDNPRRSHAGCGLIEDSLCSRPLSLQGKKGNPP